MCYRTVCNATVMSVKRLVHNSRLEQQDIALHEDAWAENNPNLLKAVITGGNPIVYNSSDYRPCGTPQYNENPV